MQVDVTVGKLVGLGTILTMILVGGFNVFNFVSAASGRDIRITQNAKSTQDNKAAGEDRDETLQRVTDLLEATRTENEHRRKIRQYCSEGRIEDPEICATEKLH